MSSSPTIHHTSPRTSIDYDQPANWPEKKLFRFETDPHPLDYSQTDPHPHEMLPRGTDTFPSVLRHRHSSHCSSALENRKNYMTLDIFESRWTNISWQMTWNKCIVLFLYCSHPLARDEESCARNRPSSRQQSKEKSVQISTRAFGTRLNGKV